MSTVQHPLTDYFGKPTKSARLEITGTGSGLDRSMVMPPVALEPGAEVDIVLRCVVEKHRHEYDEEDDAYGLVNLLRAQTAALVDDDVSTPDDLLRDAEQRVADRRAELEEAKRSAKGEDPLPYDSQHSDDPDRVGLARPDLDAAEQAIRGRTALDDVADLEAAADDPDPDD